jgi:hypothetical protein
LRALRADIHKRTAFNDGLPERLVFFAIPYIAKILIIEVAHGMTGKLIEAAWHHIPVNSHDRRAPHPEATP